MSAKAVTVRDVQIMLDKVVKGTKYSAISRQADTHPELPALLLALGGASLNGDLYTYLQDKVQEAGQVKGRSKSVPVAEEDEEPVDLETEYVRPNGEKYYSRKWSGKKDVDVLKLAREKQQYVFLYGPPGCGKTALVDATFPDLVTVVMSGDTEVSDLVGGFVPNPNHGKDGESEFMWVDGPLVVAAEKGLPLLLDEIGLGDPKVLSIAYGLMDGRRELVVTANPARGVVKAADGFFVVGATNPNAPGVRMSEALLSRFTLHAEVTTDWTLAVRLGVPNRIVSVAENLAKKAEEGLITWAPQFRELLAFRDVAAAFGQDFAVQNLLASCPEVDRPEVMDVVSRSFGKTALPARI